MRWLVGWQALVFAIAVFAGGLFLGSHQQTSDPVHSSAAERESGSAGISFTSRGRVVRSEPDVP